MSVIEGDRPSNHGSLLGAVLATLADLGERDSPIPLGERCVTCAFREGTVPNQSAGTGMVALNCTLGIDPDRFACHHGMKDGAPAKLCVGWMAARMAPWSAVKVIIASLNDELGADEPEDDEIRKSFDAWLHKVDPEGTMDVYQVARAAARERQKEGPTDNALEYDASAFHVSGRGSRLRAIGKSRKNSADRRSGVPRFSTAAR